MSFTNWRPLTYLLNIKYLLHVFYARATMCGLLPYIRLYTDLPHIGDILLDFYTKKTFPWIPLPKIPTIGLLEIELKPNKPSFHTLDFQTLGTSYIASTHNRPSTDHLNIEDHQHFFTNRISSMGFYTHKTICPHIISST